MNECMREKHAKVTNEKIAAIRKSFEDLGKNIKEYRMQRCKNGKEVITTYKRAGFTLQEAVDCLNAFDSEQQIALHSIQMYEGLIENLTVYIKDMRDFIQEEKDENKALESFVCPFKERIEQFAKDNGIKLKRGDNNPEA